jgi:phosphohistidine swiveling domain-containing protein
MLKPRSKAGTLEAIQSSLTRFRVPPFQFFTVGEWEARRQGICAEIRKRFDGKLVIIRSSAADEDGTHSAKAGEFDSVPNVASADESAVTGAIETVTASYRRNRVPQADDVVIVQEMLQRTVMSGVVFTHDLNTGAPYYVINYDDVSGLTNTVTSGGGEYANRTLFIHRGATQAVRSSRFQVLMAAVQELEQAMNSQFLDVEFALGEDLTPYLLQARAITTQPNWNRATARRIDAALAGIQRFVRSRLQRMPGVHGNTTVLGQMPDWNPAEMIGRAPRPLAMSLYRLFITDNAWREARERMEYAVPAGQPLMVSLAGQPYIDTRLSFHSYLPASLDPSIREKLVDAWTTRLREHPELHDKVEFEVAITTFSFDIDERLDRLVASALTPAERAAFREARRSQTIAHVMGTGEGGIPAAMARIDRLAERQREWRGHGHELAEVFALVDDCLRLGTIPFSMLARHGFIAKTLLISLERRGALTAAESARFQAGIRTVASELVDDMRRLQTGSMPRDAFMERYGHLRPGTYDILSARYDQMEELGAGEAPLAPERAPESATLGAGPRAAIDKLLEAEGFTGISSAQLLAYITAATVGREYGKFVFTRTLSDLLELIAAFGERNGLSRDELSFIPIGELLDVVTASGETSIEERLREIAERESERHALCAAIRLPQVLFDEAGVHVVPFQVSHPNFITNKKVTASCARLAAGEPAPPLTGRIVLIENADPGFDWIFSQHIAGLVTKYGGANSHMAIRCAEFGIPAAIGCGEQRFDAFADATQILLDCSAGLVKAVHH